MKFRKPIGVHMLPREVADFMRSLPDEFEIVPEGHVCVKWPSEAHKESLNYAARDLSYNASESEARAKHYLFILAVIDAARSKP